MGSMEPPKDQRGNKPWKHTPGTPALPACSLSSHSGDMGWEGAVSSHWIPVMTLGSDRTLLTPDRILQLRKERPGRMDTGDTRGGHRPHTIHICKQYQVTMTLRSEQYYRMWQESEPHLGTSAPQGLSIDMMGGRPQPTSQRGDQCLQVTPRSREPSLSVELLFQGAKGWAQALGNHKLLDSYQQGVLVTAQPCTPGCIPEGAKGLLQPALTFLL